ncbi:hypothetical protein OG874_37390 [Nocardia sp. NBC_00565]|uniref:hypothetical protein n=1 Tax=Nocardia sp. NBC_00565 TaxID=2975993 RepID=UPI002E815885|nr:hypothetical protein [Nocardia sp. NBC_00565]WUC02344.1 hypothetical protein OG874_37390 [Nocardia sp. NBC_00565]
MSGSGSTRRDRWTRLVPAGYSGVLALLIAGPLLGPGYLLLRDAVSTPRSYLTDSALGLGDAAPRAVPQDALLAALSPIIDGGLIVKAILLVALWAAGYGAAVLTRELLRVSTAPQLVAVTVALWNPYVAERLLQGHWSLLTGYAALPWTALAAYRIRASTIARRTGDTAWRLGAAGAWGALAGCFAAAGLTPTGALLAGCTAVVLVGRRNLLGTLGLLLVASAPWLTATALSGAGSEPSDPAGIAAFAARAEPGLGTLGSLAGLGGIWNGDSVPDSRITLLALIGTVLLLAVVATGIRATASSRAGIRAADAEIASVDHASLRVRRTLLILAVAAVVLPALGSTPWGMSVMEWLVAGVPGAGLLRDTQKYVALAMPAYALCAAAGCRALGVRFAHTPSTANAHRSPAISLTAIAFIALLVLPLFDLAYGVGGELRPVHYPAGWQRVTERIDGPGDIAVLPGGMFRKFPYSGKAPVLDPAPRMLPHDVLQTGELPVRGRTVAGEGAGAREVETLLLHGGSARQLGDLGVGWVLVERTTPGPLGESKTTLAQLDPIYTDQDLTLYRVPAVADHRSESQPAHRTIAYAAHILWAAMLVGGLLLAALLRPRPTA